MAKIFISYRRDDSAYATGIIRDELCRRIPGSEVFLDVDSIPYGIHFRNHLENAVGSCDYLVAVIGKTWLSVVDRQGQRRLDNPEDFVRIEIETALRREIPLIPVFLDNLDVPTPDQLPESMRELVTRNAIFVRPPPDFHRDLDKLVNSLHQSVHPTASENQRLTAARQTHLNSALITRGKWIGAAAIIVALAVVIFGNLSSKPALQEYNFVENYLFEDSNPHPDPWQPHSRKGDARFRLPLGYVHWVIEVTYPKNVRAGEVPLECHLRDEEGELGKFSGLSGTLPDATYPADGKTRWIVSLGGRTAPWKPGKYKIEVSTPTKSIDTSFEILPPAKATE